MKNYALTPAVFNIVTGVLAASVPTALNYTKFSPPVVIGSLLTLIIVNLFGNFIRYYRKASKLENEIKDKDIELDSLKESVKISDLKNKELKDYADKRHSFTEYDLTTFKEAIEEILDTVNTWHTPVGRDVPDSEKDKFLRKSKKDLFTIINNERRANNDDRKNL